MSAQTKAPPTLRLWEENRTTLEPIAKLGLPVGEVVNEVLKENGALKRYVEKRIKTLKAALAEV